MGVLNSSSLKKELSISLCQALKQQLCPQVSREAKVIPVPKSGKANFTGSNCNPISALPGLILANCCKKMVFDKIQCYFSVNKLTTDFQHAYREGHSTCSALTQITDDWLK